MKKLLAYIQGMFAAKHISKSEQVIVSTQHSLVYDEGVLNLTVYAPKAMIDRLGLILKNDVYTLMAADAERRLSFTKEEQAPVFTVAAVRRMAEARVVETATH